MRVWLVKDMEPVPIDLGDRRVLRTAMLAKALVERGHDVSWITSTFDHYAKKHRGRRDETRIISSRYRIEVLRAPGYRYNRSLSRVWHNRCFARAFLDFSERARSLPDIIVTDTPTTETAETAVRVARKWNIPVVLSVRDLWPDFFGEFVPPALKPLVKFASRRFDRQVSYACKNATAIVGISPRYLEWGLAKGARAQGEFDTVVPLGYELPTISAADANVARAQLQDMGVDFNKHLISFAGSWGATYDLDLVVEAAGRLTGLENAQFVLAGDGDERDRLLKQVEDLPNVVAPGWLTAKQVSALLQASALGLMPYKDAAPQGLPNKIFEHMAYGIFQISTLRGEAADLLRELDIGHTIDTRDAQTLSIAISESLKQRISSAEQNRIRHEFLARFRADTIYSDMSALIEKIVRTYDRKITRKEDHSTL